MHTMYNLSENRIIKDLFGAESHSHCNLPATVRSVVFCSSVLLSSVTFSASVVSVSFFSLLPLSVFFLLPLSSFPLLSSFVFSYPPLKEILALLVNYSTSVEE